MAADELSKARRFEFEGVNDPAASLEASIFA